MKIFNPPVECCMQLGRMYKNVLTTDLQLGFACSTTAVKL